MTGAPDAVVLAGGLGTRLREAVPDLPKPMAPVAGRPFLALVLDHLAAQGVRHAVLAVGYRHEAIRAHFGDRHGPVRLDYAVEHRPLGTGGAIRLATRLAETDPVLVVNGDTLFDLELAPLLARHRAAGRPLTVALRGTNDTARYGAVAVAGGRVVGFAEKGRHGPGLINAGMYVMAADFVERFGLPPAFSFEHDLLMRRLEEIGPAAHEAAGYFVDIGVPESYRRARTELASR